MITRFGRIIDKCLLLKMETMVDPGYPWLPLVTYGYPWLPLVTYDYRINDICLPLRCCRKRQLQRASMRELVGHPFVNLNLASKEDVAEFVTDTKLHHHTHEEME